MEHPIGAKREAQAGQSGRWPKPAQKGTESVARAP